MRKIKHKVNKLVDTYSFRKDILKNNTLYELCKIFDLSNIYMDVYSIDNGKSNVCELLRQRCENILLSSSGNQRCLDIHLKISINDVSNVAEILRDFYFEDINIWNCNTDWEQHLKDMYDYSIPIFKKIKIDINDLFHLYYKENQVEIACNSSFYSKNCEEELNKLLQEGYPLFRG